MALLKCGQTGHFFGYFADTDVGFTCFECLGNFAPSGQRQQQQQQQQRSSWASSRKRQSFHPPPPPPSQNAQEVLLGPDENGRKRSKPWRCLQQKCHLLACEECAEKLIDPNYVSKTNPVAALEQRSLIETTKPLIQAGAATPPERRASRESLQKPLLSTNTVPAPAPAPAANRVNAAAGDDKGCPTDSDSEDSDSGTDLRSKLVYRRAGQVSNSFSLNQRRPQGRMPMPNRDQAGLQVTKRPTIIPENLTSNGSGTLLEVDSNEDTEDEIDMEIFRSKYTVRSATQAADQSIRTIRWGQRMGGFTAVSRMGMA